MKASIQGLTLAVKISTGDLENKHRQWPSMVQQVHIENSTYLLGHPGTRSRQPL
jgi:hypothetical protein